MLMLDDPRTHNGQKLVYIGNPYPTISNEKSIIFNNLINVLLTMNNLTVKKSIYCFMTSLQPLEDFPDHLVD